MSLILKIVKSSNNIMYKIGFFYNITGRGHNRLILCFDGVNFYFKNVDYKLIDYQPNVHISNMGSYYYNLNYPVIYSESGNTIDFVQFLMNVPFQIDENCNPVKGLSYMKNIEDSDNNDAKLLYNGDIILTKENFSLSKEYEFYKCVLNLFASKEIKSILIRDSTFILPDTYYNPSLYEIKSYLNSINLDNLLETIKIEYYSHYRSKVGGDDKFWVYRNIQINNEIVKKDPYLTKLFKLGTTCVQEESGYTSHFESEFPLGVYEGELLENEKTKMKSEYSIVDHLLSIIKKKYDSALIAEKKIPYWKDKIDVYYNELYSYNIEKLKDLDQKLFYPLDSNYEDVASILLRINKITEKILYNKIRIVVTGDCNFSNYDYVEYCILNYLKYYPDTEYNVIIVQGHADGVEKIAEKVAIKNNLLVETCTYDWYYPSFNYINGVKPTRNEALLKDADVLLYFSNDFPEDLSDLIKSLKIPFKLYRLD